MIKDIPEISQVIPTARTKILHTNAETYLVHCQASKMELFAKIVNGFKPLAIFATCFILDVWQDSGYAFEI